MANPNWSHNKVKPQELITLTCLIPAAVVLNFIARLPKSLYTPSNVYCLNVGAILGDVERVDPYTVTVISTFYVSRREGRK